MNSMIVILHATTPEQLTEDVNRVIRWREREGWRLVGHQHVVTTDYNRYSISLRFEKEDN